MSQVIEVPGIGNVEFPDSMSESEIKTAIESQLQEQNQPKPTVGATQAAVQTALPAAYGSQIAAGPTGYVMPEAGYNWGAVKQVLNPLVQGVKNLPSVYATPGGGINAKALADLYASLHFGIPAPVIGTVQTAYKAVPEMYQAGKESLNEASRLASQFADKADTAKYFDLWNAIEKEAPGMGRTISDIYHNKGGGNAVANWLRSTKEGQEFLTNPKVAEIADTYMGAIPSKMSQVGRVVSPVLRTAGRVLGPAGVALNAYDAAQYAQQAELGQRLAQGQGQMAQHAYRQLPSQINTTANPRPGTPEFAQLQNQYAPAQSTPTPPNWIQRALGMANQYNQFIPQQ